MAPRIRVPANFGREHINSEVHGNLILKLKDGGQIKTNSMIMSLNSPVIDNLTTNMFQSTLEVDDFENEAVDCFVEAMYSGEVETLEKNIFEEVNKMAHAFEVSWLSKRCLKFFQTDILNFEKNTYDEIVFACEIASRAHTNLKQSKYVRYFVESAASWKMGKGIFLQRYMAEFTELSRRQINMSLDIARDELGLIVSFLTCHVNVTLKSKDFDENSLYLLEKLDVKAFSSDYPSHFKELVYFITDVSEVSTIDGIKPILEKFHKYEVINEDEIMEIDMSGYSSDDIEFYHSDSDDESACGDGLKSSAIQTDISVKPDWKLLSDSKTCTMLYSLSLIQKENHELELITTKNDSHKFIKFQYMFPNGNGPLSLFIRYENSGNIWSYVLGKCRVFKIKSQFLSDVPSDAVKLWKITKTPTHMKIVCNDLTVLDFNFREDSVENYNRETSDWFEHPKSVTVTSESKELILVRAK